MSRSFFRLFCGDGYTRRYAYDDGRSMERPYKAVDITRHVDTGGRTYTRGYAYGDGDYTRIGLRRWPFHGTDITNMGTGIHAARDADII